MHAELRVGADSRPVVIEVAACSIGGLCSRALRFGAGVSLKEVIVRHAVGAGLDGLGREAQALGMMMLPIRAAGLLEKMCGQADALAIDGVVGLEITIAAGRAVVPLPRATVISGSSSPEVRRRQKSRSPAPGRGGPRRGRPSLLSVAVRVGQRAG